MRQVIWSEALESLAEIVNSPDIESGYERLRRFYALANMQDNANALLYLLKEKFGVNNSNSGA